MTERLLADHHLVQAEERFRLLVDSVEDYGIFMLDPDGYIASWNLGAERIKGYTADEIIGEHFSRFYTPEDLASELPQRELEGAASGGRIENEGWRLRKDGSRFWAFVVITAMRDSTGKLQGFAKVTRDLTERKEAEERLRTSEEQFRRLVESVDEYAIFMLDSTGRVASWNSGAQKIKQYAANEIIGKSFECFYTPEDRAAGRPQRMLSRAREEGHARDVGPRVRKDGTTFHADVLITVIRDALGNIVGFSKVTRDITDQIRNRSNEAARMAAVKANKAKDDFLAVLSHELRTPLTPALAAASYLCDHADLPPELNEEACTIRRNVKMEARLIDDLLDLTRITTGKIELHADAVDAHVLVRDAVEIANDDFVNKQIELTTELTAERHHIWADPIRIQQVFWNLVNNAAKFTGSGGRIVVKSANDQAGRFTVEVSDTGIGIDAEQQERLFQAFEQGERAITRRFGGLGLGLTISKTLVNLHGGSISAESKGKHQGATFRVTLDAIEAPTAERPVPAENLPKFKGLRILLVEDDNDTRRILTRVLGRCGHEVSSADCVAAALKLLETEQFETLISDIGLPDSTGYELVRDAKQRQPLKSIALSGFGMEQDVQRSLDAGFDYHLTKPVDLADLQALLRKFGS
jgi:PAS domain S-box-containing protein